MNELGRVPNGAPFIPMKLALYGASSASVGTLMDSVAMPPYPQTFLILDYVDTNSDPILAYT